MTPEELHNIFHAEEEFWWYRGMRTITETLLDAVPHARGLRGLDAGCGTGYNALAIEQRYGVRMTGVDLAPLAIHYCRKRGFERSLAGSITQLPWRDASFDFVSSIDVLPVLPAGGDLQAIREFHRVLRPGGWLLLRVAAFSILRSRHSRFVAERHRYRAREVLQMLATLRFRVLRHSYANSFLSPVALVKFRLWEPLLRAKPASGVAAIPRPWLNRSLASVLAFEAALIRRGFRFPFGQSFLVLAQKV
jgi:SAM-dependent methyltransferase